MKISSKIIKTLRALFNIGFFHIFGSSALIKIASFAYGTVLVRIISKQDYGVYSYAHNIYNLAALLSGLGMVSAILQLCSENQKNKEICDSILRYGMWFGVRFNLIIVVAILSISIFIPLAIAGSNILLGLMCLLPVLSYARDCQSIQLRTSLRNKEYSQLNLISSLSVFAFALLGAWLFGTKGMIYSQYLVSILLILFASCRYRCILLPAKAILNKATKRILMSVASISALNNGLTQLYSLIGIFILGIVVKDESVIASYKVASIIPVALGFVPQAAMMCVYPYFALHKNDKSWVINNYRRLLLGLGALNIVISITGIIFAPWIIRNIFGSQYLDAVLVFRILMVSFFLSGTFRTVAGNLLVTQRRLVFNLIKGLIGAALTVALNILLIPQLHSVGAALTQLAVIIVISGMGTIYLIHIFRRIKSNSKAIPAADNKPEEHE